MDAGAARFAFDAREPARLDRWIAQNGQHMAGRPHRRRSPLPSNIRTAHRPSPGRPLDGSGTRPGATAGRQTSNTGSTNGRALLLRRPTFRAVGTRLAATDPSAILRVLQTRGRGVHRPRAERV